jgi:hypothetical protein
MNIYNKSYYKRLVSKSRQSSQEMVPVLMKWAQPKSVLDLGCGVGTWLETFSKSGVQTIYGFDGAYVNKSQLLIPISTFTPVDLSKKMPQVVKVDLAISLEVAEHLPEQMADQIVDYLTSCSDRVCFGGAVQYQGGSGHINEKNQSYWVNKFLTKGFVPMDLLRKELWNNQDIEVWYRQNSILYYKCSDPEKIKEVDPGSYDVIHPELFGLKFGPYVWIDRIKSKLKNWIFSALSKIE